MYNLEEETLMKKYIKKLISIPPILAISISLLTACSVPQSESTPSPSEKSANETVYAFVGKDIQNPYNQKVFEGFETACNEIGIEAVYKAPTSATADKQIEIINELIDNNVDGIAISANDADALESSLTEALNSGIEVISVDSPVNSISRKTHIQQADPEVLGRNFMKSAYDVSNGEGGFAILTSTGSAPNQNQWIRYLKLEMDENPEKYSNMPLIEIAYGDDDATKSYTETQYLLQNDAIKTIIVPTTIGLSSAAKALKESGKDVNLIGLGFPSELSEYIKDGTCDRLYIWNTANLGYLTAYTLKALDENEITGSIGETFTAGSLGEKTITADKDNASEIILGDPIMCDSTNIDSLSDIY